MARILLIEPDQVLAKTYHLALQQARHEVWHVASAQAAIDDTDALTPDIIILEPQLAGHNGVEFLYELRSYAEWQAMPVILLSSLPPKAFQVQLAAWDRLGVVAYYYKPQTTLAQLRTAVDEVLVIAT